MINSIDRCLEILEILSNSSSCGITELAEILGIDKSSVHRIITTMKQKEYVEQIPDSKRYVLGLKVLELSNRLIEKMELVSRVRPFLEKLNEISGETSHLAVLRRNRVVYVDRIESKEIVTVNSSIGGHEPIYCSATGKAILAFLSPDMLTDILTEIGKEGLETFTDKTISSIPELEKELEKIRQNGFAFDNEERYYGVRCLAAPIRNHTNKVVASIGISSPVNRMTEERIKYLSGVVMGLAKEASVSMGYMAKVTN